MTSPRALTERGIAGPLRPASPTPPAVGSTLVAATADPATYGVDVAAPALGAGGTVALTATVRDAFGNRVDVRRHRLRQRGHRPARHHGRAR